MTDYGYQSEKLSQARRSLMLPHSRGEEESIAEAFHECSLAFHRMDESGLDDNARHWIATIKEMMDTSKLVDPPETGQWMVKARSLDTDQRLELSRTVDELAHWFDRKFWSDE